MSVETDLLESLYLISKARDVMREVRMRLIKGEKCRNNMYDYNKLLDADSILYSAMTNINRSIDELGDEYEDRRCEEVGKA